MLIREDMFGTAEPDTPILCDWKTFEESPDIRRIGEEREKASSSLRAAATTHDSSKSDKFSIMNSQFISEDAKNLYNGLLIRNYKIQQEINAYARHFRI